MKTPAANRGARAPEYDAGLRACLYRFKCFPTCPFMKMK